MRVPQLQHHLGAENGRQMMEGYPKHVSLNNEVKLTLRPMEKADAQALLGFFNALPLEDRQFLKDDVCDPKVIQRWADNLDYESVLPVLAVTEAGRVVGDATLHTQKHGWSRHVGEIRCVVAKDFQRTGIGTLLCRELFANAQQRGLDKIVAQMAEDQVGAQKVFERLGFRREAVLENHVTDLEGRKRNLVLMSNHVEELWQQVENLYLRMDLSVEPF
jgi:RimJ/RimL family protein N-acetyltransferase